MVALPLCCPIAAVKKKSRKTNRVLSLFTNSYNIATGYIYIIKHRCIYVKFNKAEIHILYNKPTFYKYQNKAFRPLICVMYHNLIGTLSSPTLFFS